eukprot:5318151-Amphidinium_carterae.1
MLQTCCVRKGQEGSMASEEYTKAPTCRISFAPAQDVPQDQHTEHCNRNQPMFCHATVVVVSLGPRVWRFVGVFGRLRFGNVSHDTVKRCVVESALADER